MVTVGEAVDEMTRSAPPPPEPPEDWDGDVWVTIDPAVGIVDVQPEMFAPLIHRMTMGVWYAGGMITDLRTGQTHQIGLRMAGQKGKHPAEKP